MNCTYCGREIESSAVDIERPLCEECAELLEIDSSNKEEE